MQALQVVKYTPNFKEAVQYTQIEKPVLKNPNEVLVRVRAAGVNPVDAKVITGNIKIGLFTSLPAVNGGDFAGVVEQIGSQVHDFQVGDEVYGTLQMPFGLKGTFAQYTVVDTTKASIAKKPANISFEEAAAAGIAFLTAYQGVVINGHLNDTPKTILVIGASGGVGHFAVQISKAIHPDNKVIAICSSRNNAYVQSMGADETVNYDVPEAYQAFLKNSVESIDIIFDAVGGDDYYKQTDALLKKKGVYSTAVGPLEHVGSEAIGITTAFTMVSRLASKKLFGHHQYSLITSLPHKQFRTEVAPLFNSERIKKTISEDNIVPLSEGHKAFEKLMTHRTTGKIVFRVD